MPSLLKNLIYYQIKRNECLTVAVKVSIPIVISVGALKVLQRMPATLPPNHFLMNSRLKISADEYINLAMKMNKLCRPMKYVAIATSTIFGFVALCNLKEACYYNKKYVECAKQLKFYMTN